jgi:hypothetical protein
LTSAGLERSLSNMESERDAAREARAVIAATQQRTLGARATRWLYLGYAVVLTGTALAWAYGPSWSNGVMTLIVILYGGLVFRIVERRTGIENQRMRGQPVLLTVTIVVFAVALGLIFAGDLLTDPAEGRGWVGVACASGVLALTTGYALIQSRLRRTRI